MGQALRKTQQGKRQKAKIKGQKAKGRWASPSLLLRFDFLDPTRGPARHSDGMI
jgi:hypothetical protein